MARVGKYSKQVAGLMMFIHLVASVPIGLLRKLNPAHQNNCQVRVRVWRSRWRSVTGATQAHVDVAHVRSAFCKPKERGADRCLCLQATCTLRSEGVPGLRDWVVR